MIQFNQLKFKEWSENKLAIAVTRLTEAGLDIPKDHLASEPELTLYARLQDERDDAYPYYNALLNRLNTALLITVRDSRILSLPCLPSPFCPRWIPKTL
jgi:hypothetical protein